jgi:hypothetical protein
LLLSKRQVSEQAQKFLLCHIRHPAGEAVLQQQQGTLAYTTHHIEGAFLSTTWLQGNMGTLPGPTGRCA